MIVSFSVSNFRSFAEEETLNLVASKRIAGSHDDHVVAIPDTDEAALRTAVLYGANGAGKSNLFKALDYVKSMAIEARKKNSGTGREAFRFGLEKDAPSTFDLRFMAGNKLYRYGLKVDDQRVLEEWLVWVIGGREKVLYERMTNENGSVVVDAKGITSESKKLEAMATVGGPQNQTFLATIKTTLEQPDYEGHIKSVLNWFDNHLLLFGPASSFGPLGSLMLKDKALQAFASDFIQASSTGVDGLEIEKKKITEDQLRSLLPEKMYVDILDEIQKFGNAPLPMKEGKELILERADDNHFYEVSVHAAHRDSTGETVKLDMLEESDGTRRLLDLLPGLFLAQRSDTVFFIDEIDRSMHPMLVVKFMAFFLKSCGGRNSQVIVTTHESNLLDLELLRRDEIWFAEKDHAGATRLYSLSDFKVRKDLEIRKHYLQGRFGAVPFLGNLDRLSESESEPVVS